MKLVECVPNISEGRRREVIDACAASIASTPGVKLLDVDPGADTNRTVLTFVGDPESVLAACHALFETASARIDMSRHQGSHARQAAVDVCPFVPLTGVTMADCVALARRFGAELGEKGYSVYLYEEAATAPERKNLANVRKGEYESLETKVTDPAWKPDFGPPAYTAKVRSFGAPIVGAREFLIAWNLNVNTDSKKLAHKVALDIREKGRALRDGASELVRDAKGELSFQTVDTSLATVKSVGWQIETDKYGPLAQISINLCNYRETPMWKVYETARKVADGYGITITGAEIVGLVPREALLESGRHYRQRMGESRGVSEKDLISTAIRSMGLSDLYPFDPAKKVVEYCVESPGPLASMSLMRFCDETASSSPAPGGGSVAALAGALSASLSAMVTQLTFGRKGFDAVNAKMESVGVEGHRLKDTLLRAIDEDTAAFNAVMAASRLPKGTEEEKAARDRAIAAANLAAAQVPLHVARCCRELVPLARAVVESGNPNSASDGGVAAAMARSACVGAVYNVMINLEQIVEVALRESMRDEARRILSEVEAAAAEVHSLLMKRWEGSAP